MVRASRQDPGLGAHLEVRLRRPEIGGHRKLRHGLFCLPAVHIIDNQPETVPQVNQGRGDTRAFFGRKYQTGRILPVSHGKRLLLDIDGAVRDRRADLQHMRL